jgi:cytochrome P450
MPDTTTTTTSIDPTLVARIQDQAARHDPYPLFTELLRAPVSAQDTAEGRVYTVSTYREVVAALQDPRLSSDVRKDPALAAASVFAQSGRAPMFQQLDPPEHDAMRAKAMRHFGPPHSPGYIDSLHHSIEELAQHLVDEMAGKEEVDIVSALAYRLPVAVICRILGVPDEDEPTFSEWVEASVNGMGDPDAAEAGQQATAELARYMGGLITRRKADPRDDMLSRMAAEDGPGAPDHENGPWDPGTLVTTAIALLVAGHETTVNLIANGVLTALRRPSVIDELRADPGLVVPMVEEVLRFEPPAQLIPNRIALDDITLAGVTIPKGSSVTLAIAAANRDPERFPDAGTFLPRRTDNVHLGFGNGVHYCFGAPLARLEGQAALRAFLLRAVDPQLVVDPPPYRPGYNLRGPSELRVRLAGVGTAATTGGATS